MHHHQSATVSDFFLKLSKARREMRTLKCGGHRVGGGGGGGSKYAMISVGPYSMLKTSYCDYFEHPKLHCCSCNIKGGGGGGGIYDYYCSQGVHIVAMLLDDGCGVHCCYATPQMEWLFIADLFVVLITIQ